MEFPDHPFWNFSVSVHGRPGVHEACLSLQTRCGTDVNCLFFCCWVGASGGGRMTRETIQTVMDAVEGWQETIVRPVWKARWRLKSGFKQFPEQTVEALRQTLIQAELNAEHLEQLQLAGAFAFEPSPDRPEKTRAEDAAANMLSCFQAVFQSRPFAAPRKKELSDPLSVILSACFPGLAPRDLNEMIHRHLDTVLDQHPERRPASEKLTPMTYEAILDTLPSPTVFVGNDHIIRYLNRAARSRYARRGFSDLAGKSLFDCHSPAAVKAIQQIHTRLMAGENEVFLKVDKDGLKLTVVGVRDSDGNLIGYYERFENAC